MHASPELLLSMLYPAHFEGFHKAHPRYAAY